MNRLTNKKRLKAALAAWLVALLIIAAIPQLALAADDVVTGIEFDTTQTTIPMYVDDDAETLKVWATLSGSSSKKDVTTEAAWSSTSSSIAKVANGAITAVSSGTAAITARYKGFTATVTVKVAYMYDRVKLTRSNPDAELATKLEVELGDTVELDLTAYNGSDATDATIDAAWSTSNAAVATVDKGVVTLLAAGTAKITGKYKGKSDTVTIVASTPYKSMAITPASLMEFKVGDNAQALQASAIRKTGEAIDITKLGEWKSGNTNVVTVEDGVVTPVGTGTTTVQVAHLGTSKSVAVVVRPSYQAMKLSSASDVHLRLQDAPLPVFATVLDNPDYPLDVTGAAEWTSSNVYVATVTGGVIIPKAPGTARITATYKGLSREVAVTVYPEITKLEVAAEAADGLDGFVGGKEKLPAVAGTTLTEDSIDVSKLATWTTSDSSIVAIEDGKWVAKQLGTATLTARIGTRSVQVAIAIHEKPLALLTASSELSIVVGKEAVLPEITVIYENGEQEVVTDRVVWKASSPNLLVKDGRGKGLLVSRVTLTATFLGKSTTIRTTIEEEIISLSTDVKSLTLNPGKSKTIKVIGTYKNGKTVTLSTKMNWAVSSSTVAAVKGSSVKALAEGSAKLIGSYQDHVLEIPLLVKPKLKKLSLSSTSLRLAPNSSETVEVNAEYIDGPTIDATAGAVWTTSNAKVAVVSGGKITAVAKGSASIKATYDGKTATVRVTVR